MPDLALHPGLDATALTARFAMAGRIQIADFLAPASAAALRDALFAETRWRRLINGGERVFEIAPDDYAALPGPERERIDGAVLGAAAEGFQFRYEAIRVSDDAAARAADQHLLTAFAVLMGAPETLSFLRAVTGIDAIAFADAQATLYRPGDFLTRHDDDVAGKGRRLAYVLGLSDGWRAEWGGLLLFNDGGGGVAEALVPRFGALSLFTVPQPHSVSPVAPYAPRPRLSITGWLRTAPAT